MITRSAVAVQPPVAEPAGSRHLLDVKGAILFPGLDFWLRCVDNPVMLCAEV